ncbi:MAG TPA: thermonuclease family protein [Rhizomicrobium sp.]
MASLQILAGLAAGGAIVLAGGLNPASDLAPAGERVALAAFEGPVRADVVRVIDGDTFEANAQIWIGETIAVRVRIAGIDAPELHARCDDEYRRAIAARNYLAQRIEGGSVRLTQVHNDKYGGRVDADVSDSKGDIGQQMIAKKLARPYWSGHRGGWCDSV